MINTNMKIYPYYSLDFEDDYGQPQMSERKGFIKMSINLQTQAIADNIKYKDATYVALTLDSKISDKDVILLDENTKLKVLYVNPYGKYKQIYMSEML